MQHPKILLPASLCIFMSGFGAAAQEGVVRPILSEPYSVTNAREAMDEIMRRDDEADAAAQALLLSGEIDMSTYVPEQPMYQQVSWPSDSCTDMVSLFPSPPEGWVIASDWGQYKNPIGEERGQLFYVRPPDLPAEDPDFISQTQTVSVQVSADAQWQQMWDLRIGNETMREVGFDVGPFGYPVMKFQMATMLGAYYVDVSGTGEENAPMFLEKIIGCAIDGGLLANGVDPASLTR